MKLAAKWLVAMIGRLEARLTAMHGVTNPVIVAAAQ